MQERIILFDLDGTLTDSGPGIMKASQFALHAYGVERDWQELDFFVGPPLDETFGQFMPKEDIPGAIDQFRVYYHDVGWLENAGHAAKKRLSAVCGNLEAREHGRAGAGAFRPGAVF